MPDELKATLDIYGWPGQAFWRYFEVLALRQVSFARPILEIGCGDGRFSTLLFDEIDDAIDVNPRSVERCKQAAGNTYRRVRCLDARQLQFADGGYATIYANCVMEHIPDLAGVLAGCYRGLRCGGTLVMTVPLEEMNRHLLLPWGWYARMRQRQLEHVNLFTLDGWAEILRQAGFTRLESRPYLFARHCKLWDSLDVPGCIGYGRYRLAPLATILGRRLLPNGVKRAMRDRADAWLSAQLKSNGKEEPECATLLVAYKERPEAAP